MIDNVLRELEGFKRISFDDAAHSYHISDKRCVSVTELISRYEKPFDAEKWSAIKAAQRGISPSEMINLWNLKRDVAAMQGKVAHTYIESRFTNHPFIYPKQKILDAFSGEDLIWDRHEKIVRHIDRFVADITDKMTPIASELIIGDEGLLLCGTVDQIFHNHKSDALEIWDWKSSKGIEEESKYPLLPPLEDISDCNLNTYSLQTCLYKIILERNTSLTFGNSYIVWFHEDNETYQVFRCRDYTAEARLIASTNCSVS